MTDNGSSKHLWNVGQFLRDYKAQHLKTLASSSLTLFDLKVFYWNDTLKMKYMHKFKRFKMTMNMSFPESIQTYYSDDDYEIFHELDRVQNATIIRSLHNVSTTVLHKL
jgi:hypothetical protein